MLGKDLCKTHCTTVFCSLLSLLLWVVSFMSHFLLNNVIDMVFAGEV